MLFLGKLGSARAVLTVLAVILVWVPSARADIPTFKSETFFCSDFPVWIPKGTLFDYIFGESLAEATITYRLKTRQSGRIKGTASYHEEGPFLPFFGAAFLDLPNFRVSGNIETIDDVVRVSINGTADGTTGRIGQFAQSIKDVSVRLRGRLRPNGSISGTLRVRPYLAEGVGPRNPIQLDLAQTPENDGSWLLTMKLRSPNRKRLKGWGVIDFANGRTLDLVVTEGRYDRERDRSRVLLEIDGRSGPNSSRLKLNGIRADADTRTIERAKVKYRLFGQEGLARIGPNICN
jgi:hypothetical protein